MLRRVREHMQSQAGFTLAEVLVVCALIGVLAAIALPAFLDEQAKGHDASAKSNARNVMTAVESCFSETKDYAGCDTLDELEATDTKPGVEITDTTEKKTGAVSVTATGANTFTVVGYSQTGNTFGITKAADGTFSQTCTGAGSGSCQGDGGVW